MVAVLWYCDACRKPVSLAVTASKNLDGDLVVHADQPISVHMKQHERG